MATEGIIGAAGHPGTDNFAAGQAALRRLAAQRSPGPARGGQTGAPGIEPATIEIRFPADRPPAVRQAKVRLAQARIAAGFYDLREVRQGVVENMLCSLGRET